MLAVNLFGAACVILSEHFNDLSIKLGEFVASASISLYRAGTINRLIHAAPRWKPLGLRLGFEKEPTRFLESFARRRFSCFETGIGDCTGRQR